MSKEIIYDEPYCDPNVRKYDYSKVTRLVFYANTAEEYAAHRAAILNPSRGITLVDPPELPESPDPAWFIPEPTTDA